MAFTTTTSGLQFEDTVVGTGAEAKPGRTSPCTTPAGFTRTASRAPNSIPARIATHWHDPAGETISVAEWRSIVEGDPALHWDPDLGENAAIWRSSPGAAPEWIDLEAGNLEARNPSTGLLAKLVSVAGVLQARVVGEEGEAYEGSGIVVPPPLPTIAERFLSFLSTLRATFAPAIAQDPGFGVGARVRDFRGRPGTVTRMNLRAERGLGCIIVQYDTGQSESYSAVAHGLEPL